MSTHTEIPVKRDLVIEKYHIQTNLTYMREGFQIKHMYEFPLPILMDKHDLGMRYPRGYGT